MNLFPSMVRTWIKQHPEITAQFRVIEDSTSRFVGSVYVEFFTGDIEKRKLGQMRLSPADQVRLIQSFLSAKPEIF